MEDGVVFNIEARNYYSKSTFIRTLIKQEKLVFILVILYIREYLCLKQIVWALRYAKISKFGYPVPKITNNTQP